MNTDDFGLEYVTIGGGDMAVPKVIDDAMRKYVAGHYLIAGTALILLALYVVYLMWFKSEAFNPTQTLRDVDGDQFGLGNREFLDNPGRDGSNFAKNTQSQGQGALIVAPGNAAAPGSLAYQVLNSADFNCANRKSVGDNAWDWMNGVAHENAVGRPQNDNDFSKVLSGR